MQQKRKQSCIIVFRKHHRILCIIQNVATNSNRCAITDGIADTPQKSEMLYCAIIVGLAKYRRGKVGMLESSTSLSKEPKMNASDQW